jgi:hypothetical protein
MVFCPRNCTENENYGVHSTTTSDSRFWNLYNGYWTEPVYSTDSQQEIDAGMTQGPPTRLVSGVSVFCKKPYAVCDYPDGDLYVRAALEQLQAKSTSEVCHSSMKAFLCTLYRRRCRDNTDEAPSSKTHRNRGVWPVCFGQCRSAYLDCGFGAHHMALMCGEYIKAGWVEYDSVGRATGQCDSPAPALRPAGLTVLLLAAAAAAVTRLTTT